MKTLKNCPFCGGSASIIETEGPDQTTLYTAVCQQCGVKSPDFAAAEEAAASEEVAEEAEQKDVTRMSQRER